MTHPLKPYWDRVQAILDEHRAYLDGGYIEIVAHGIAYRSIPGTRGVSRWVSWEPYRILYHFSELRDPDATVRWVPSDAL